MTSIRRDLSRVRVVAGLFLRLVAPHLRRRLTGQSIELGAFGAQLRETLQLLGVTYIKLGQFLATRFDIIPEEICKELARLFDEVPAMPASNVRRILEREFARPVEQLFSHFEWTCVAAASVAQVHKAITNEGRVVAVKVQRPGIVELFAADMRFIGQMARIADRLKLLGSQPIAEVLEEFRSYTELEMNFLIEGRTADRLRANAGEFEEIPEVIWALTSKRVLTMNFMEGFPLSQVIEYVESGRTAELKKLAPDLDLEQAVRNLARACLRQLFVTGFFHADPHPGNIILRGDGTVVFIDFGIFGQLSPTQMEDVAGYIEGVATGNVPESYRHFLQLLQTTPETDFDHLKRDMYAMMHTWYEASRDLESSVSERHIGTYINEFIKAIRRNQVRMGYGMILFWRALMTLDSTALRFQQQFDLLNELQSFFVATRYAKLGRYLSPDELGNGLLMAHKSVRDCPTEVLHPLQLQVDQNRLSLEARMSPDRSRRHPQSEFAKGIVLAIFSLPALLLLSSPKTLTSIPPLWGLAIWAFTLIAAILLLIRHENAK